MKHKIKIYIVAEDGPANGTQGYAFASKERVLDYQRDVLKQCIERCGLSCEHCQEIEQILNEHPFYDADAIDEAWDIYEEHLKDPLETYHFDECEIEIDIPIPVDELKSAFDALLIALSASLTPRIGDALNVLAEVIEKFSSPEGRTETTTTNQKDQ